MTAKKKPDTGWNLDGDSTPAETPTAATKEGRGEAFGTYLPADLHKRLKLYALETDQYVWAVVQTAIREYLDSKGR